MKILDKMETLQLLCKSNKKWGMFISWVDSGGNRPVFRYDLKDTLETPVPYLCYKNDAQAIMDGEAYLLFNDESEMCNHYDLTVGDDGPTQLNPYNGPFRVYAITCSPKGQLMNENT